MIYTYLLLIVAMTKYEAIHEGNHSIAFRITRK